MTENTLIEEIRALTGVTTSQLSDNDLSILIGMALDEYATYNPKVNFTADSDYITTVDGQPNYAMPSDALWIIEVFWSPYESEVGDLVEQLLCQYDPAHPVDLSIYYHQLATVRFYFGGHWKILNNEIWLVPPPASGDVKVPLLYATARTLDSMADQADFLFKRLVAAYVLQRRATDLIQNTGWRAGAYQVSQSVGQAMAKKAENELQEVRQRLAQAYTGISGRTASVAFGGRA